MVTKEGETDAGVLGDLRTRRFVVAALEKIHDAQTRPVSQCLENGGTLVD